MAAQRAKPALKKKILLEATYIKLFIKSFCICERALAVFRQKPRHGGAAKKLRERTNTETINQL